MVCALHAVNCSCSVYVKSQTVLSGLEWKPTLTSSSPAGASPGGASAVPFGPVLPGRTGNKRTSWGRFLKVWGGQEPGWRCFRGFGPRGLSSRFRRGFGLCCLCLDFFFQVEMV